MDYPKPLNPKPMNLTNLIESGANVNITVSLTELSEFANDLIRKTKTELEEVIVFDKAETYPTPKWVSEYLNVDVSTLWRWSKRNYLVPIEIGGKRRYKMSDVKAILNGGRTK